MITQMLGRKIGMTQIFDEDGTLVGVSAIEVEPVCIIEKVVYPSKEKAKIGAFKVPGKNVSKVSKPRQGFFKRKDVAAYRIIKEVDVSTLEGVDEKSEVGIDLFEEGTLINVRARSKGKGFQGGMKRHNWRGQPRTHGSTTHRRIGSAGACTYPGKIIKGIRMPGHMGNAHVTVKNLKVVKIDKDNNTLFLKGAVPGAPGTIVTLSRVEK